MKVIHISARSEAGILGAVKKAEKFLAANEPIGLVTTIQHLHKLEEAVKYLNKKGFTAKNYGQILGCRIPDIKERMILYIGDGMFHPKGILIKQNKRKRSVSVIAANPFTGEIKQLAERDIELLLKHRKGALLRFHSSVEIGVLVSLKQGQKEVQAKLADICKLEKRFKNKSFYYFACDTLDFNDLENFPFIECWVNTMCPRIGYDDSIRISKPIINYEDLIEIG